MQNFETNKTFIEDEKKYRKLRKNLRQIEHLNLLPRPLNEEEKQKVLKRNIYRQQLNDLIAKYPNNELSFRDPLNQTNEFENEEIKNSNSSDQIQLTNEESLNASNASNTTQPNDSIDLDEITSKMNTLIIEKPIVISKPSEQSTPQIQVKETPELVKEQEPIKQQEVKQTKPKKKQEVPPPPTPPKPIVCFDTFEIKDAHQDLITTLDICTQNELIVTGSRDTSIKVWSIKNLKVPKLIHSFGGHSGSITLVKFWSIKSYAKCLNNIALATGETFDTSSSDDDETIDDEDEKERKVDYPLIVSSSLDCSIRIWNINKEKCIKEFYLYNPINHFCLNDLSFTVALNAGKIQLWTNLTQLVELKAFDDTESVCCIKMIEETKNVYALSNSGILKKFEINNANEKHSLDLVKKSDIYTLLSESHTLTKNFKSFEVISDDKIVLINDNQSFLILFNLTSNTYQLVSTNTHIYGFTSCFYKINNFLLVSAYDIDNESSNINVFDSESFQYLYSFYDSIPSNSLSSLIVVSKSSKTNDSYLIVGTSRETVKLWSACELMNNDFIKSGKKQVKCLKMCKKTKFHVESCNEDTDEDDDDSEENEAHQTNEKDEENDNNNNSSKSYCSIQ